jgi:glycine dehydrogenase subunit 1
MYPYIPNTPQDEQEMLQAIGLDSMDLLFEDIPKDVRLTRPLNIPPSKSELEVSSYLKSLADKNCSVSRMACFLGAGAYDHYIPSVIDAIISRSEFYTSYTPSKTLLNLSISSLVLFSVTAYRTAFLYWG